MDERYTIASGAAGGDQLVPRAQMGGAWSPGMFANPMERLARVEAGLEETREAQNHNACATKALGVATGNKAIVKDVRFLPVASAPRPKKATISNVVNYLALFTSATPEGRDAFN